MAKNKKTSCSKDVKYLLNLINILGFYEEVVLSKGKPNYFYYTGSYKSDVKVAKEVAVIRKKYGK